MGTQGARAGAAGRQIILFGGKGGVGKTTCSAAVAAASAAQGKRTLVLTSDMAPSLSDVFDLPLGDTVRQITAHLFGVEISQDAIVRRWKTRFSRDFTDILSQLIDLEALDAESRHHLLDYIGSAPSLREETMLDLIVELVDEGSYDRVIWDTAPAGETLNLLNMPRFIRRHLTAGAKVFEGLDRIGRQIIGKRSIAGTMDEWIKVSERIAAFIRDRTDFIVVAKPETLVVKNVERVLRTLEEYRMSMRGMVINCVIGQSDPEMRAVQAPHIAELEQIAGHFPIALLPFSTEEMRGVEILRKAGALICEQLGL